MTLFTAYIVQSHRFDIFEDIGCYPAILNTAWSLVLISAWPIVLGLITAVYCGKHTSSCSFPYVLIVPLALNIYHFYVKRRTMKALLQASSGSIDFSRYIRLMTLSGIDILCTVPLGVWGLYSQMTLDVVVPWPGWKEVHSTPFLVNQIPAALWRSDHNTVTALELTRWSSVMCAIIFFMFFGFADEAKRNYSSAFKSVAKRVGHTSFAPDFTNTFNGGARSSKHFGRRPMSSVLSFDDVSLKLPTFDTKECQSPANPTKLDPFGSPYGSALTVSTSYKTEKKRPDSVASSQSSVVVPYTPISPNSTTQILPPPRAYDADRRRQSVRPPVMTTPLGGFGGAF